MFSQFVSDYLLRLMMSAGTMLFGESTTEAEAGALLSQAADAGVDFFDSAEMYPVPQRAETQGMSEIILGRWLQSRRRSLVQLLICSRTSSPVFKSLICKILISSIAYSNAQESYFFPCLFMFHKFSRACSWWPPLSASLLLVLLRASVCILSTCLGKTCGRDSTHYWL